jgi:hypothetical protein
MNEKDTPDGAGALSQAEPAKAGSARRGRPWAGLAAALCIGLALGYAGTHYGLDDNVQRLADLKKQYETVLAQHLYDLNSAMMRADALQGQLAVEESTRKSLEATLQATQQDLGRARDQLAFYNQLLPAGPNGSISIRALDIERRGPTLYYKVLLMRNAPGDETFNGLMEFVANGSEKGKTVKISLHPALAENASLDGGAANTAKLALSFDQFQRGEGVLSIPPGFIPKAVTLNILEGETVRASRTVNLAAAH